MANSAEPFTCEAPPDSDSGGARPPAGGVPKVTWVVATDPESGEVHETVTAEIDQGLEFPVNITVPDSRRQARPPPT